MTLIKCEPLYMMVAQQIVFQAICEASVLVLTHAPGIIDVPHYDILAGSHAYITSNEIMNVYSGRPLYIKILKFDKVDMNPSKQEKAGIVAKEQK